MKTKIFLLSIVALLVGCSEDYLTRDPKDSLVDNSTFWDSESNVMSSLYALYTRYFPGYESGWTRSKFWTLGDSKETSWTDDAAQKAATYFDKNVPSTASSAGWTLEYVRKLNLIIDRLENSRMGTTEKKHWLGTARFLRAMEYSLLVKRFGDMPWYDKVIDDTNTEELYRPRDSRTFVMDKVMEDLEFAMENVKIDHGTKGLDINQDVVKAFASQIMLFEGTWQKYRAKNNENAAKYLNLARKAADDLIQSGRYTIAGDYKGLVTSVDLVANSEIILYRAYVSGVKTHSVMGFQLQDGQKNSISKDLIDSYLSSNGLPIFQEQNNLFQGDKEYSKEMANRDPRLYANIDPSRLFLDGVDVLFASSGYFSHRFINYDIDFTKFSGQECITDAPVMRYGEVLLNYIEACAELSTLGKYTLAQNDFDISFNKLRTRASVQMPTVNLSGSSLTVNGIEINDPNRDIEVPSLIWEIRRERRIEMAFEGKRYDDLRRWNKLSYADMKLNPKLNLGAWLDKEAFVTWYNANVADNAEAMITLDDLNSIHLDRDGNVGYIVPTDDPTMLREYGEKDYLYPIPTDEITLYAENGVELKQNPNW